MEFSSQTILHLIMQYGYVGIFCLLMFGILGVPFPDELIMTASGYLIFKGYLHPATTIVAAFLGAMCGISVSYTIGRVVGTSVIDRYGYLVHVTPEKLKNIHAWFERFGKWTLLFGYFLTGFRHLVAIIAGTAKLHVAAFALFAYTGAFIWSLTFISLGYFLGEKWHLIAQHAETIALILTIVVCAAGAIYLFKRRLAQPTSGKSADSAP
jgi:membrane protein DedA with SNARE-associated domain